MIERSESQQTTPQKAKTTYKRPPGALCLRPVVENGALEGNRDAALPGELAGGGPVADVDADNPRAEKGEARGITIGTAPEMREPLASSA